MTYRLSPAPAITFLHAEVDPDLERRARLPAGARCARRRAGAGGWRSGRCVRSSPLHRAARRRVRATWSPSGSDAIWSLTSATTAVDARRRSQRRSALLAPRRPPPAAAPRQLTAGAVRGRHRRARPAAQRQPADAGDHQQRAADPHRQVERVLRTRRRRHGGRMRGQRPGRTRARSSRTSGAWPPRSPAGLRRGSRWPSRWSSSERVVRGDDRADGGDRDQPGGAGDRVVDRRGDPGVRLAGVGEHGGGERRHGHRQPEREHQQRRQDVGRTATPRSRSAASARTRRRPAAARRSGRSARRSGRPACPSAPTARTSRSSAPARSRRTSARCSPPPAAGRSSRRTPAARCRRRSRTSARWRPRSCGGEQAERQHRRRRSAPRGTMNVANSATPSDQRPPDRRARPAQHRLLDQPERDPGQPGGGERRRPTQSIRGRPPSRRGRGPRSATGQARSITSGTLISEDPPPRGDVDDLAAQQRPGEDPDAAPRGPLADRRRRAPPWGTPRR